MTLDEFLDASGIAGAHDRAIARLAFEAGRRLTREMGTSIAADLIRRHPGGNDLVIARVAGKVSASPAELVQLADNLQAEVGCLVLVLHGDDYDVEHLSEERLEALGWVRV